MGSSLKQEGGLDMEHPPIPEGAVLQPHNMINGDGWFRGEVEGHSLVLSTRSSIDRQVIAGYMIFRLFDNYKSGKGPQDWTPWVAMNEWRAWAWVTPSQESPRGDREHTVMVDEIDFQVGALVLVKGKEFGGVIQEVGHKRVLVKFSDGDVDEVLKSDITSYTYQGSKEFKDVFNPEIHVEGGGYRVPPEFVDAVLEVGKENRKAGGVTAYYKVQTAKDWLQRVKEQKDFITVQNQTLAKILEDRPILELDGKRLAMLTDKGNVRMLNTELMTVTQAEALADWIKRLFPDEKGV